LPLLNEKSRKMKLQFDFQGFPERNRAWVRIANARLAGYAEKKEHIAAAGVV
jgi:hypothetical protein